MPTILLLSLYLIHFPVDGGWSVWGNWTACSATCGIGAKTRKRTCSNPVPQNGGASCRGNSTQQHSCFDRTCPGIAMHREERWKLAITLLCLHIHIVICLEKILSPDWFNLPK